MSFNFAYLSGGRLYLKLGQATVQSIASEFGQAAQQRGFQMQRRNNWKQKSLTANFMSGGMSGDVQQDRSIVPVAVQGVCPTSADRLIYTLEAGEIGGIFTLERFAAPHRVGAIENLSLNATSTLEYRQQTREKRLFHSANFKVDRIDFHPDYQLIACATIGKDGTANIAMMPVNGVHLEEVTEGDSIDLAPKWMPGFRKIIVFQSAGICRDGAGYIVEQQHSTIEQLDIDNREVIILASDPKYDLLSPQMDADGTLYYIRRPYRPLRQRVLFSQTLKDALLIPVKLLIAIFEWLNFFTRRYTGKSLLAVPQVQQVRHQQMLFLGRWVDVGREIERNHRFGDADSPALVPRSWELVKQKPHQEPQIIGRGVLAFDVGLDGQIVYSNGSAIYGIVPGGVAQRLLVDRPIEQVVILDRENHLN
ncbi:hypothetical protein [Chamaesiphon sp. VAR_48_metabat_135_sub]|uniref:hypothetical protein n=1 Tax=Chamaesiphon sp. VAR_48_metabat_135_sub TaxID=2964699 RepID=UPI00286B3D80|nr:hypothetical protein [Chamaesiphon sp. VAR_48_metabat_135_sub]